MASLRDKSISGVFWSFLEKVGASGIQFVVTIFLARLLTPKDFGLIGMLAVFMALSYTFTQAGFNQALIQKKKTDEEDYSSVFYINLVVSFVLYLILFFTAPFIAEFYEQTELVNLTRVLGLVFVINSFSYVQETRLRKNLEFKKLMYIHLPSTILSGVVAITMALLGFGVWSLVAQRLVMRGAFGIQIWFYSKWKPLWVFNLEKAKGLFSFGSRLMFSGIIHTISDNLYQITIGKFFPVQMLGYYENADKMTKVPTNTISSVLNTVAFPVFSQIQDDNKKLREGYKKIMQQVLFWLTPILIIAAIIAEPLFNIVFGEKWLPAVPFFQIFCFSSIFTPLSSYNLNIVNIKGRSDIFLKLEIIKKTFLIVGVAVAISYGIYALVYFRLIYGILVYFLNSAYAGKFIGYSTFAQIKDILPIFVLTGIMGVSVYILKFYLVNNSDILQIVFSSIVGIILYWGLAYFTRVEAYFDFKNLFNKELKKRFKKT